MAVDLLRQFVVGEIDSSELIDVGVMVSFAADRMTLQDASVEVVEPTITEIAAGYVASWARGEDALRRWAQVILGLTAVDLVALEDAPDGEALLEAIWDAAAGRTSGIDLASRLAS